MKDFGILGLKTGENKYSFPRPTEEKIKDFFIALNGTASTVFIDCTSCFDEHISEAALRYSDVVIQIISPDIRSMAYYSAYEEKYNTISNKCIKVINTLDNDLFLPINEVKTHFKDVDFIFPFSHELKQQAITGTLTNSIKDVKYKTVCQNIARWVLKQ